MLTIKPHLDEALITKSDFICLYTEGIDTCVGLALTGKTWACLAHLSWPSLNDDPFGVDSRFIPWVNSVINRYQKLEVNWKLTLITNNQNSYSRAEMDIAKKLSQKRIYASSVKVIKDHSMWKVEKYVFNKTEYATDFQDKLISRLWECHSFKS